jgi:hypothetical protein
MYLLHTMRYLTINGGPSPSSQVVKAKGETRRICDSCCVVRPGPWDQLWIRTLIFPYSILSGDLTTHPGPSQQASLHLAAYINYHTPSLPLPTLDLSSYLNIVFNIQPGALELSLTPIINLINYT